MESIKAKFVAQGMQQLRQLSQQASGQGPDPLVQLKEKELQLKHRQNRMMHRTIRRSLILRRRIRDYVPISSNNGWQVRNDRQAHV